MRLSLAADSRAFASALPSTSKAKSGRCRRRWATQSFEVTGGNRDDAHTLVSLHEMVRDQDPEVSQNQCALKLKVERNLRWTDHERACIMLSCTREGLYFRRSLENAGFVPMKTLIFLERQCSAKGA